MTEKLLSEIAWSGDLMARKGVAKFLTNYLDSNDEAKVLNINSAWGGGKTFFLTNWLKEQSEHRACVYFNAWENDFTGDPFLSLVAAIKEQLGDIIGTPLAAENVVKDFTKKASKALIAATPALTKGVIKKLTGVDVGIISDVIDSDALSDAAEKAVEKLINTNKETLGIVNEFKIILHKLILLSAHTIATGEKIKPVYFFIDELDRCRPTYAIELLERIKHLFDVNDCKFIIATDTAQLSHSIRAVYGEGFASDKYLKRFFDVELTLDNNDTDAWVKSKFPYDDHEILVGVDCTVHTENLGYFHEGTPVAPDVDTVLAGKHDLNEFQAIFVALAKTFGSKLRELEKIALQIDAIRANISSGSFHLFWAAYLVFLKDEAPDIFEAAVRGSYRTAFEMLNSRYPPKKLYFVFSNISVHEIFLHYIELYRLGTTHASDNLRRMIGNEYEYIRRANMDFCNARSSQMLRRYPTLVELAHSID